MELNRGAFTPGLLGHNLIILNIRPPPILADGESGG